jgi:hypothetical protein
MPNCQLCDSFFPFRKIINGKIRNLSHRKYCLSCSPFGKHNTRPISNVKNRNSVSVRSDTVSSCRLCKREYVINRKQGHSHNTCNSCLQRIRQIKMKQAAVTYKGGSCTNCGYKRSIAALIFHHIDPSTKEFSIAMKYNFSWERIKSELDKCELLCANCHAEVHFRKWEKFMAQDGVTPN